MNEERKEVIYHCISSNKSLVGGRFMCGGVSTTSDDAVEIASRLG